MKKIVFLSFISLLSSHLLWSQPFVNPLHIPDTIGGTTYNLELKPSKKLFLTGDSTDTYGINGDYLGPTLIMNKGETVQMHVTNGLTDMTTMHWHGMHVAPEDDGGPHTAIDTGETWSPSFEVLDDATTFWYHPHLHHKTAEQVYKGAAGMIIVRETGGINDSLPRSYGIDDFPLIIQDKSFDGTNQFIYTELADTVMVNGTLSPYLEVPSQMVRFRVLNASNQRVYNLGIPPGVPGWIIGSDGGLLENRLNLQRMLLAPGERAEIVVDFGSTLLDTIPLLAFNSEMEDGISGGPNGPGGGPNNSLDGVDFTFMNFIRVAQTSNPVTSFPTSLNQYDIPLEVNADRYRTKTFTVDSSGFPFYINNSLMDLDVINDTVKLNDIEVWTLINQTDVAHPWHIHDIQFYILDINGNTPPPHLRGKKDVVLVNAYDTIRYITQFTDFTSDTVPYMYHCHNLFHEDGGMMGQFVVTETGTLASVKDLINKNSITLYPNPTSGFLQIEIDDLTIEQLTLYSVNGQFLEEIIQPTASTLSIDLSRYTNGLYLIELKLASGERVLGRVIKN